ncbi:PREDICTED: uncharacterized protein LOC104592977 isoform X3 [Nelumbo nucifera]|uniref:Uncharacterized protein LOC104592977 isoform X3 n=1 Tax=Nelumbo nucifera TaxID=4432 RepID=A0A1U7ZQA0_NELNU|nr:PREDICTED: uncharacterized protein LOC104592977 isoform X3 [Nelumbo nucifera]
MLASFWLAVELLTLGNLWTTLPLSKQLFSNLCPTKNHEVHDQPHSKPPFFLLFPAAAISSEFQALDSDSFITSIRSERLFLTELSKPFVRMKPVQKMDFNPANAIWDPQSLEKFLFAIEDPEVLKAPLLKSLYCLLVYLFSNSSLHCSNFEALKDSNVGSHQFDLKVTFAVICKLSNFLFKELQRRFEQLLSGLLDVSVNTATGQDKVLNHPEDLTMLLRCCLIIMLLLVFDQSFLMEKCQILLVVLRKLCSPDLLLHVSCHMKGNEKSTISLKRSVSHERIYASDNSIISVVEELDASMSFSEQIGMPIPILCSMLEYSVSQPIQHVFSDARGADPGRHKESMAMLMHMAELLLFSFSTGLEFLWKSCIFMMMAIMNLIIFEEGNLDALRPLLGFEKESAQPSLDKSPKVLIERSSSALVAWKFQKIKTMRLRSKTLTRYNAEAQDVQSETLENTLVLGDVESQCVLGMEEEDTCNGSNFIKIIRGGHPTSDFDDLVDFIECKQGKDYSKWLKDRERYRKWKCEKVAAARHKRKKTLQKFLTGK